MIGIYYATMLFMKVVHQIGQMTISQNVVANWQNLLVLFLQIVFNHKILRTRMILACDC